MKKRGKRIPISEEKIFELREKKWSFYDIANYFKEQGIDVSYQTIRLRCQEIYAKKGIQPPKAMPKNIRNAHEYDEEIYELRKSGLLYTEIARILKTKGYDIDSGSIGRKCKELFEEKGEEEPVVSMKKKFMVRKNVSDEEIYILRKQRMSYEQISEYFEKQGKIIGLHGVRKRCKSIFAEKGEEEPYADLGRQKLRKKKIDEQELYDYRAQGYSFEKIARIYHAKGIKICTSTLIKNYNQILEERGEEKKTIKSIPVEEVVELRNKGKAFSEIAKYYNDKGIKVSNSTISNIYMKANEGKEIKRRKPIPEETVYELRKQGLTYEQIRKALLKQDIKASTTTIRKVCTLAFAKKQEVDPKSYQCTRPDEETLKKLDAQFTDYIDEKRKSSALLKEYQMSQRSEGR